MDKVLQDLKFGFRMATKDAATSSVAVLALGLGIGLTTTMFSITYGALYRGLPVEQPERVMHLERAKLSEDIESMEVTVHDFHDWRAQQSTFEDLAAFYSGTVNLSGAEGRPERFDGAFMTANAFDVIRATPLLGRAFQEGDDTPEAPMTVILGYTIWRDRFERDRNVTGSVLRINGEQGEVIGVMPEGFAFPLDQEIWVPMRQDPAALERGAGTTLEVFGRLKQDVSLDQAGAEFATITRRLEIEYPETNEGVTAVIQPYTKEFIGDEPTALLWTMLGAVFFVLLIACANVANLLLSKATVRSKEVAVRSAMGASRLRVVLQMLAETFVLALIGGVLGLGIAWIGVRLFNNAIADTEPPYWIDIRIDPLAVAFVLGLTFLATLIAGVLPAIKASGPNVAEVLKDEARGSSSMRLGRITRGLVVAEVALSCGLLVAAGLMVKSITRLRNIDFRFPTENVFTARVGLFESQYPDTTARLQFFEELETRLAGIPGVEGAGLATSLPGLWSGRWNFAMEGQTYERDADMPLTRFATVTPGFFEAFRVSAVRGRLLSRSDRRGNMDVAVVNEPFVQRFFPAEDPIGRRIRLGDRDSQQPWVTIVGIVPDLHMGAHENEEPEGLYIPLAQSDARFISMAAQVSGPNPMRVAQAVRDAVVGIDRDLPIYWVRTLQQSIEGNTWFYRVFGVLFMVFGVVALLLATIGLYGVMAFAVNRRTQEFGVRMALGADAGNVLRLIVRQGMLQLGVGLALGLALAAWLSRLLQIVLFDVDPRDPLIFAGIVVVLIATGVLANLVPARRATRIDPMVALRYD